MGDSPIGLAGWLLEKYHEWTDVKKYTMPDDETITSAMMHWISGAAPGLRFYKAVFAAQGPTSATNAFRSYSATPLCLSFFPREIAAPLEDWVRAVATVQFFNKDDKGGHFPSVEVPGLLIRVSRDWFGSGTVKCDMQS